MGTEKTADDRPAEVFLERRHTPDRRAVWRGGRRDSDWRNRPPGSLGRVGHSRFSRWLELLARYVDRGAASSSETAEKR